MEMMDQPQASSVGHSNDLPLSSKEYHNPEDISTSVAPGAVEKEGTSILLLNQRSANLKLTDDRYRRNGQLSYFSLPGELRNQIMDYVLVPGSIHPRTIEPVSNPMPAKRSTFRNLQTVKLKFLSCIPRFVPSVLREIVKALRRGFGQKTVKPTPSPPGVQLLATCRQAYAEGHGMYYSLNTFHLPCGSAQKALEYFEGLDTKHLHMIQSVALRLSLKDLTPTVFYAIEQAMRMEAISGSSRSTTGNAWARWASIYVQVVWRRKLVGIRNWKSKCLESVSIETSFKTIVVAGSTLQSSLSGFDGRVLYPRRMDPYRDCSTEVGKLIRSAHRRLWLELRHKVARIGLEATKAWVAEGAPGAELI